MPAYVPKNVRHYVLNYEIISNKLPQNESHANHSTILRSISKLNLKIDCQSYIPRCENISNSRDYRRQLSQRKTSPIISNPYLATESQNKFQTIEANRSEEHPLSVIRGKTILERKRGAAVRRLTRCHVGRYGYPSHLQLVALLLALGMYHTALVHNACVHTYLWPR